MASLAKAGFGVVAQGDTGRNREKMERRKAVFRLAVAYWAAVFFSTSVLWAVAGTDPIESAPGKLASIAFALVLTTGMTMLLKRTLGWPLWQQAGMAFALSLAATPVSAAADYLIYIVCVYPQPAVFEIREFAFGMIFGMSLFFGWCCLYLVLCYSFALAEGERRMAALREEALSAQMRALAYQVNPHFLFNTLNAMAGLIEEGANAHARGMVLKLSAFLRKTLTLDPMQDIPLSEELALQSDYLAVESTRFSDRMKVSFEVDDDARDIRVPPLILQPIFENAVKYGVGATRGAVEIALWAERLDDVLVVTVENDTPPDEDGEIPPGMGIGLRNVAERIATHFGGAATLSSGYIRPGRFAVRLTLPWHRA
ncbi:histidine kinase [Shinella sp. CPCC 101442]|uniref:sensor histidine kinase n=1 Tax=Shinella sp. CPCC 101442 TaxID=2932265 RepID=UPI002153A31B|nr:histidine kinase [Shinella sp. CPCC 101442]MCR6500059.1 histidine kinase [Shinella sp. CPCC 101442]